MRDFDAGERVWDLPVRVAHWLLVASVGLAWFTRHGGGIWHEIIGYVALAVVLFRLVWGLTGPRYARFANFLRGPRATLTYARQVWRGRDPRHLGHNPLGGWMIVALLAAVTLVGFSGWLYTTDRFWGVAWVETLHRLLSNAMFALVALHIGGVLYGSYRHDENLIASMIHGRKRQADASGKVRAASAGRPGA